MMETVTDWNGETYEVTSEKGSSMSVYCLDYYQSLQYFAADDEKLRLLKSLNFYEMRMVSTIITINDVKKLACYEIGASENTENLRSFGNTILEEDDYEGVLSTLDDLKLRILS